MGQGGVRQDGTLRGAQADQSCCHAELSQCHGPLDRGDHTRTRGFCSAGGGGKARRNLHGLRVQYEHCRELWSCADKLARALTIIGSRRTRLDDKLGACAICSCALRVAVHVPLEAQQAGLSEELKEDFRQGRLLLEEGRAMSETAAARSVLAPYCTGIGLDMGFGGTAITPTAICFDMEAMYCPSLEGHRQHLRGDARHLPFICEEPLTYIYSSHFWRISPTSS